MRSIFLPCIRIKRLELGKIKAKIQKIYYLIHFFRGSRATSFLDRPPLLPIARDENRLVIPCKFQFYLGSSSTMRKLNDNWWLYDIKRRTSITDSVQATTLQTIDLRSGADVMWSTIPLFYHRSISSLIRHFTNGGH
uniref:Uncharacterized protein n=1 Tax=Heterorhabditis bacteriophora TaxID=37862 RepID=A0A1I7WFE3_HETBA